VSAVIPGRPDAPDARKPLMRFVAFGLAVVLGAGALTVRLFAMQIGSATQYGSLAQANRTVMQAIPSTRGLIYDSSGVPLVTNVATYSVRIRPSDLPEPQRPRVVATLAKLLGIDETSINIAIDSNPGSRYDLVRVASDVDPAVADFIAEAASDLPGVSVVVETRRNYAEGSLFGQLLGYTGPISAERLPTLRAQGYLPDDLVGVAGLEATYEEELRGIYGVETVEKDATGRKTQVLQVQQEPVAGASLRLNIDLKDQQYAQQALVWGMKAAGLKRGVVIVANPQTGAILAMVSLPTYDDNLFAGGISQAAYQKLVDDPNKPLTNHAISEHFPPGSTYKLVTATAGLADGLITSRTQLQTAPYIEVGGIKFYDWNRRGFGLCDVTCGFAHSSDTYFYQLATKVGADRLAYWAGQYGFGPRTGIDLPAEATAIIPSTAWKMEALGEPIYPGDVFLAGIGQGYDTVTPIQLLNAYMALANGGTLYRPRIVGDVLGPDGTVVAPFEPEVIGEVGAPASVLKTMRLAARQVVLVRHTYNLVDLPIVVAGKTGTAQFGTPDSSGKLPFHTWFAGFVPKDPAVTASDPDGLKAVARTDSDLAILVFCYDSVTKGSAAVEIAKYFLQLHYGIQQDYRLPSLLGQHSPDAPN
jgi:penicillin-binding protein 2